MSTLENIKIILSDIGVEDITKINFAKKKESEINIIMFYEKIKNINTKDEFIFKTLDFITNTDNKELLNKHEAAKYLKISQRKLDDLRRAGIINAVNIINNKNKKGRKLFIYEKKDLNRFVEGARNEQ